MSAVRLRCNDPERQRSPDGKYHEGLLAEHLRHVPVGQGTVLADVPQVPLETASCNQQPGTTKRLARSIVTSNQMSATRSSTARMQLRGKETTITRLRLGTS